MKNCSNHSFEINGRHYWLEYFCMAQRFAFVTFEILVVFISLLIVSTSSLVIYRITKAYKINKKSRNRAVFAFISLSVSDIGVGLFTVPLYGSPSYVLRYLPSFTIYVGRLFMEFPFLYSCVITVVITVEKCL